MSHPNYLTIVACLAFSAAHAEPMFDLSEIRLHGIKATCGEYIAAWEATEMNGDTGQDFARQGAFLGYVNGLLDGLMLDTEGDPSVMITRFYANCTERKGDPVVKVLFQTIKG